MHFDQLTAPEQRVLGCLIEKRWTTPDQYPLSLNGLRLACNQATNRDPVTTYDEVTVRQAAERLSRYGLARLASGHGSRATKYRHLAEEGLGVGREELAVLAVLLLRGPQTPGELKARSERMAMLPTLADIERVLGVLAHRGYVRRIGRRPGQKEDRFEHMLGGQGEPQASAATPAPEAEVPPAMPAPEVTVASAMPASEVAVAPAMPASDVTVAPARLPADDDSSGQPEREAWAGDGSLESRVAALESEVASLRAELARLREGAPGRPQVGSAGPAA